MGIFLKQAVCGSTVFFTATSPPSVITSCAERSRAAKEPTRNRAIVARPAVGGVGMWWMAYTRGMEDYKMSCMHAAAGRWCCSNCTLLLLPHVTRCGPCMTLLYSYAAAVTAICGAACIRGSQTLHTAAAAAWCCLRAVGRRAVKVRVSVCTVAMHASTMQHNIWPHDVSSTRPCAHLRRSRWPPDTHLLLPSPPSPAYPGTAFLRPWQASSRPAACTVLQDRRQMMGHLRPGSASAPSRPLTGWTALGATDMVAPKCVPEQAA